jgi:hypothetical protein
MRLIKARLFLPHLDYLGGRVLAEAGDLEEGYNDFLDVYREAKSQVSRRTSWPNLFALSKLESKIGEPDKAEARRQEAQKFIAFIADHIDDSRLRGAFLKLPAVREIWQNLSY